MTARMIAWAVATRPICSALIASLTHSSRLISTPFVRSDLTEVWMIFSTLAILIGASFALASAAAGHLPSRLSSAASSSKRLPIDSSSLAAVIQIVRSVGHASRALFSTACAFLYDSRCARASQSSTESGQHSTARCKRMRASFGSSSSTAAFHSITASGIVSSAFRSTARWAFFSVSRSLARSHSLTDVLPIDVIACAATAFACVGGINRIASSQTSSDLGHASVPFMMMFRAA
mmetsp:Transcript_9739/g.25022  ORF Transcript_9739/g.25022 Transcript_9739/m.25022 type:complete len:235 (+) Transcript_9739:2876-3580(+)